MPTETVALLNQEAFSTTNSKMLTHWDGQFSRGIELNSSRFASAYFYGPEAYLHKPAEVDRLLQQAVSQAANR